MDDILSAYKKKDIKLLLVNPNRPVMEKFALSGLVDRVGRDHFFVSVHDAVNYSLKQISDEEAGTLPETAVDDLKNGTDSPDDTSDE